MERISGERISGDYWDIQTVDMRGRYGDHFDTKEEATAYAEVVNERMRVQGYDPLRLILTHTEWYRYFDIDGCCVRDEITTRLIERLF